MKVLVVVAHPDDETLGAGGTIARHADAGDEVHVEMMTDGVGARADTPAGAAAARATAAATAMEVLGAAAPRLHDLPDNGLDTVPMLTLARIVETALDRVRPTLVYTHHAGDLNIDHRRVHEAVLVAARPHAGSAVREIRAMEVPSSTEWAGPDAAPFVPTLWTNVEATLDRKLAALAAYDAELRPFPHPRSPEGVTALARLHGARVGLPAAEAFRLLRRIEA